MTTHRNPEDGIVSRLPRPVHRLLVIAGAAILLPAGTLMLVLPGPGLLLVGAGLALLASEFPSVRTQLQRAATIVAAVRARLTGGPDGSFKFRPRAEGR